MKSVKYIQPNHRTYVIRVESYGFSVKFRTPENYFAHAKRIGWLDGGDEYVNYKGAWYSIAKANGNTFTVLEYHEVSVSQLGDIIREAVVRRSFSTNRNDYSWEEITAIRCYADATGLNYYSNEAVECVLEDFCTEGTPETMMEDASQYDDDVTLFSSSHDSEATDDSGDWTYDDGGRSEHFKAERVGDCVCRAVAIATGKDYMEVYNDINELAKSERTGRRKRGISSARNGVYKNTVRKLMESYGWYWHPTMLVGQGCKVHLRADELPSGRLVVSLSKHVTCVIDGIVHDTYDPSRGGTRCVYGYWSR